MTRRLPLWGCLFAAACGGPLDEAGPPLKFNFVISAALADVISSLQVSLVTKGRSLGGGDCVKVQTTCLVDQITRDRFIKVQDGSGAEHLALVFPLNLKAGSPNSSQDVSVRGIPLGKDYGLVIEALSKGSPPLLAGSSCNFIQEITAGTNPNTLAITIKPFAVPVNCDPRVEK